MKQFEIGKGNVVPLPPDAFSSRNGALPAYARDENEFQGFVLVKWGTKWNRFLIKGRAEFQIDIRMNGIECGVFVTLQLEDFVHKLTNFVSLPEISLSRNC